MTPQARGKRSVELRLDPGCIRRWQLNLATALRNCGFETSIRFARSSEAKLPTAVETLLSLEATLLRVGRPRSTERLDRREVSLCHDRSACDVRVDLTAAEDPLDGMTTLRPLYDGMAGEAAALSVLVAGHVPTIEIEKRGSRRILARAVPSLDGTATLNDSCGLIFGSTIDLMLRALADSDPEPDIDAPARLAPRVRVLDHLLRRARYSALRKLYDLCCYPAHWRVGWRFVDNADVWTHMSLAGPKWRTVRNPAFRFLADPFPVVWQGQTYVFAEDFDQRRGKGIISVVPFNQDGPCGPIHPVLEETWHLSYPFLIEHGGEIWMIPEASQSGAVSIYRADPFPIRWVKHATLLQEVSAADASIVKHEGKFWMFAATAYAGRLSEGLSLFSADDLFGAWRPHPKNPVLLDAGSARPAGNLVLRNGRLWRPVQDCRMGYGRALGLAEVLRLDGSGYGQVVRAVVRPGKYWGGRRLHTLNRADTLECIDGSANAIRGLGACLGN